MFFVFTGRKGIEGRAKKGKSAKKPRKNDFPLDSKGKKEYNERKLLKMEKKYA